MNEKPVECFNKSLHQSNLIKKLIDLTNINDQSKDDPLRMRPQVSRQQKNEIFDVVTNSYKLDIELNW